MASPPQERQRGMPQTPRALWGWWLVLLALLVWNAVTFLPAPRPEVKIPSGAGVVARGNPWSGRARPHPRPPSCDG
jgi:hypothetical protein